MKRVYWMLVLVLLMVLAGAGVATYVFKNKAPPPAAAVNTPRLEVLAADVSTLAPVSVGQVLVATGSIRALQQAQIKSQVSAVVTAVAVLEGQAVRVGQVLATTDAQDYQTRLAGSQASLLQAQTQVAIAQRVVDNNKALIDKGFISPTAADTAAQQLEASKAAVKVAQSSIELAQKALRDTAIVSPIAGVVSEKLISAGDKVSPDMRVFTITQPSTVEFEGILPAAEAALLALGQTITVTTEGMPAVQAVITRLNAVVNPSSRTVGFYAAIKQAGANYRPGSYATGKVQVKVTSGLAVPAAALRDEAGRQVVYTLGANQALLASPVTAGLRGEDASGTAYVAVEGLVAGTQYISRNLGPLRVGSVVTVGK